MFTVSPKWKTAYPGAVVGLLAIRDVLNPPTHAALDARKEELQKTLRSRFADHDRPKLRALPTLQAYAAYYKRFRSTYHVPLGRAFHGG